MYFILVIDLSLAKMERESNKSDKAICRNTNFFTFVALILVNGGRSHEAFREIRD